MKDWDYVEVFRSDYITRDWEHIRRIRKPVIAAVAGYALGGGNELAMACDIVIAADNAKFGQPEINLGIIPGAGGTQRLPRAVGKAKAMDMCLTARMMDAAEAERSGLVSRVVALDKLMEEAMAVADKIAAYSLPVVMMVKESVNRPTRVRFPRASCSSGACSTPDSPWRTRRKAWTRSPPKGSRSSRTARCAIPGAHRGRRPAPAGGGEGPSIQSVITAHRGRGD